MSYKINIEEVQRIQSEYDGITESISKVCKNNQTIFLS